MADVELRFRWYPKQEEFRRLVNETPALSIGYGGSMGGGKSHAGRSIVLERAFRYPGTKHLIFRRNYKELWDNHISRVLTDFPFLHRYYNGERKEITLPAKKGQVPSVILFGYASKKGDITKFQGSEFVTIFVDEAQHVPEGDLNFLRLRLRYAGPDNALVPKMPLTFNPGGRSNAYLKRVYVDRDFEANERPSDYAFLEAHSWDNIGWAQGELRRDGIGVAEYYRWTDEQRFEYFVGHTLYGNTLNSAPETERLMFLMGDWNVFAGQFFVEWRRERHVIRPFRIPAWWKRFCAADWGYSSPACNLWFAIAPDEWTVVREQDREVLIPPRSLIVYRESYLRMKTSRQLAEEWTRLSEDEAIAYRLLDPAFGPTRGGGVSVGEEMAMAGWSTVGADNDRAAGWSRVRGYLSWRRDKETGAMEQHPHLFVFETCVNLVRTMPQQIFDEKNTEDLDTDGEDHAVDPLRYGVMSRPPVSEMPIEFMDDDYAEAALRAAHEERQGSRTYDGEIG